jgi:hypothetical protein
MHEGGEKDYNGKAGRHFTIFMTYNGPSSLQSQRHRDYVEIIKNTEIAIGQ